MKRIILMLLIIFSSIPLVCQASAIAYKAGDGMVNINGVYIGYDGIDHMSYSQADKTMSVYMIFPKKEVKTFQIPYNHYKVILQDYNYYLQLHFQSLRSGN